jgi:membrane protein insertase Oxa1/YidC/SpoIIIJ
MTDTNTIIEQALNAEERELLRRIGDEPAYAEQALSLFKGQTGWVNLVLMVAQSMLFVAGILAAWQFFNATDVLTALHWGLPAAVALLMALAIKLALYPVIQANRVIREMKRLELQIATRCAP